MKKTHFVATGNREVFNRSKGQAEGARVLQVRNDSSGRKYFKVLLKLEVRVQLGRFLNKNIFQNQQKWSSFCSLRLAPIW